MAMGSQIGNIERSIRGWKMIDPFDEYGNPESWAENQKKDDND